MTTNDKHSTLEPAQDMGTLLMVLLQVTLQHPNSDPGVLQYGTAGKVVSAEFERYWAMVEGKTQTVPNLTSLLISTDKKMFKITVEEIDE